MIAVIDYGLGNLYSIGRSLDYIGAAHVISRDVQTIIAADKLILPGVGAFRDAIKLLEETGLADVIKERAAAGVPLMGICLGMQLLFDKSFEYGTYAGLGLINGAVCPIEADLQVPIKVPQIGWNSLSFHRASYLTRFISEGDYVYYVHSYYAKECEAAIVASSEYGVRIPGIVASGNVSGCQFHPEKSGGVGLAILRAFATGEEAC